TTRVSQSVQILTIGVGDEDSLLLRSEHRRPGGREIVGDLENDRAAVRAHADALKGADDHGSWPRTQFAEGFAGSRCKWRTGKRPRDQGCGSIVTDGPERLASRLAALTVAHDVSQRVYERHHVRGRRAAAVASASASDQQRHAAE